jgi:hypothetical protein
MNDISVNDLTVRQVRQLLTQVESQDMTVRDLRAALFVMDDQETLAHTVLPQV